MLYLCIDFIQTFLLFSLEACRVFLICILKDLKTKTKYRISVRGPAIWNDFVEDCLRSIEKTFFFKVKMKSKLLNFDNEISYSKSPK